MIRVIYFNVSKREKNERQNVPLESFIISCDFKSDWRLIRNTQAFAAWVSTKWQNLYMLNWLTASPLDWIELFYERWKNNENSLQLKTNNNMKNHKIIIVSLKLWEPSECSDNNVCFLSFEWISCLNVSNRSHFSNAFRGPKIL